MYPFLCPTSRKKPSKADARANAGREPPVARQSAIGRGRQPAQPRGVRGFRDLRDAWLPHSGVKPERQATTRVREACFICAVHLLPRSNNVYSWHSGLPGRREAGRTPHQASCRFGDRFLIVCCWINGEQSRSWDFQNRQRLMELMPYRRTNGQSVCRRDPCWTVAASVGRPHKSRCFGALLP